MFGPFNTNNFLSPQFNTQYHQTQLNQNAASGPLNLPHPIPQNGYSAHSRTMPNSMLPPTAVPHNYIPQWYPPPHTSYQTLQPPPQHQDRRGHSLSGGSESDRISPSNSSHSNDNNDHWQPLNIKHERMEPITDPRLLQHHHGFAHNANVHQDMPGDISTPREHYNNGYVSIPGLNFDAKNRRFTDDELRPQPIIRKRKKVSKLLLDYSNQILQSQKYWQMICNGIRSYHNFFDIRPFLVLRNY